MPKRPPAASPISAVGSESPAKNARTGSLVLTSDISITATVASAMPSAPSQVTTAPRNRISNSAACTTSVFV